VKFRVTIESDEDDVFVAECPALPGCISQGKTRDEAMANIRDAIHGYVESLKNHGEPSGSARMMNTSESFRSLTPRLA
jgi:predicted RNase H-like HicB family nuclease